MGKKKNYRINQINLILKKLKGFLLLFVLIFFTSSLNAEILKKLEIQGNERVSDETIKVYGEIQINKDYSENDVNDVIKKLYDTKFFSNISVNFVSGILSIDVKENPIIETIIIEGEKANKFQKEILKFISLKEKSSYIESEVKSDIEIIKSFYKSLGFYSVKVDARKQDSEIKGRLNLIFDVQKGEKTKITKIYFIGDKKIKDKRLRDVIASEEAKFWKFLTRNIYLNSERIQLDKRLLKNYYKSQGYYDVEVLSSSAELKNENEVELRFTVNAGKRFRIKKLSANVDSVFDKAIFQDLNPEFKKYAGKFYSPFSIKRIISKIDQIIDQNELQFVQHSVTETPDQDGIDIVFNIFEGRKIQIERVNIKGNSITNDSVIRSELEVDEGDPYSAVKVEKSIANLKARNIFKTVKYKIVDGSEKDTKIMEIEVEEKATGEISAGAGVGTEGTSFSFNIKENNYLGKGLRLDTSAIVSTHAVRGGISITNPNYNYSGNLVYGGANSTKTDKPESGYENTVTRFNIGTEFEQYDDVFLTPDLTLSFDDLRVDGSASSTLKKQAGDFSELNFGYGIKRDKRDRVFMPTDGTLMSFRQRLPVYADQGSIFNSVSYSGYHLFTDDIVGALKFYGAGIVGIDDDVRLSQRLKIPLRKLRGFEQGKIGPKDGNDYVGGNYAAALNFEAALPNILPESSMTDISLFMDFGNLWGADYDSSIGESDKIRSAIGINTNMFTPIGPLSFVFAQPLSKADSDTTETFRFQLGTSF